MTESLKPSAEARADWNKDMERVKDEQQARIDATVDEWMKDEGTVENALLEAFKEVSGDMALLIAEQQTYELKSNLPCIFNTEYYKLKIDAINSHIMALLVTQIRKQMREQVEEKLYG